MTFGEFIAELKKIDPEWLLHGRNCPTYSHPEQPRVSELIPAMELCDPKLDSTVDMPLLPCGCIDLNRLKAIGQSRVHYLGMGVS